MRWPVSRSRAGKVTKLSSPSAIQDRPNAGRRADRLERVHDTSPEWLARLRSAKTRRELEELISNFLHDLRPSGEPASAWDNGSSAAAPTVTPQAIQRYLSTNLHRGPSLKDLSNLLGHSDKYCSEIFRSLMGEPFSGCLKRLRIERAMQLLRGPDVPQGRIAAQLGFSDQFAFSHFFKKVTGYSPTEFRKRGNPTHKNSRRRL